MALDDGKQVFAREFCVQIKLQPKNRNRRMEFDYCVWWEYSAPLTNSEGGTVNKYRLFCAAAIIGMCFLSVVMLSQHAFAQAPNDPPADNVTGMWKGSRSHTLAASMEVISTEVSFDLQQSGDKIVGTARWGLSPSGLSGTGGPLQGIKSGNKITFQVPSQSCTGEVELSGDEMRGSLFGPHTDELVLRREK